MILCTTEDLADYKQTLQETLQEEIYISKIEDAPKSVKDNVDILLTYGNYDDAVTPEELSQLPSLKWVQVLSSGTDQLPFHYLSNHNIFVTTVKGIHAIPISEYVMSMVLFFAKRVSCFQSLKADKVWEQLGHMNEVYNKKIGILGTGEIGKEIAKKASGFGMITLGVNQSGREVDYFNTTYPLDQLEKILPQCDYLCSALPSNNDTKNLINRQSINHMKDGVFVINVGRGDLMVEEDFLLAMNQGKIQGAALDVFREEPLSEQHPFWELENLVITPHASASTDMYMKRASDLFIKNYESYRKGDASKFINLVLGK